MQGALFLDVIVWQSPTIFLQVENKWVSETVSKDKKNT